VIVEADVAQPGEYLIHSSCKVIVAPFLHLGKDQDRRLLLLNEPKKSGHAITHIVIMTFVPLLVMEVFRPGATPEVEDHEGDLFLILHT